MPETLSDKFDIAEDAITIVLDDERWAAIFANPEVWARELARVVMASFECPKEVAIVLANDTMIRQLNDEFRGMDKATNVLSFPADDGEMLGDVILSVETLEREAAQQHKTVQDHATHLLIHGLLHLLGYDHELGEQEAEEMEAVEIAMLAVLNIANPYE